VDCFHVKGVTEHKLDLFITTKVCKPIPREHAFHTDNQALPVRGHDAKEALRIAADFAMYQHGPFRVENADVLFSSMKINSAVVLVGFGVESHEGPLWSNGSRKAEHTPKDVCPRGALYSIPLIYDFPIKAACYLYQVFEKLIDSGHMTFS